MVEVRTIFLHCSVGLANPTLSQAVVGPSNRPSKAVASFKSHLSSSSAIPAPNRPLLPAARVNYQTGPVDPPSRPSKPVVSSKTHLPSSGTMSASADRPLLPAASVENNLPSSSAMSGSSSCVPTAIAPVTYPAAPDSAQAPTPGGLVFPCQCSECSSVNAAQSMPPMQDTAYSGPPMDSGYSGLCEPQTQPPPRRATALDQQYPGFSNLGILSMPSDIETMPVSKFFNQGLTSDGYYMPSSKFPPFSSALTADNLYGNPDEDNSRWIYVQ